MSLSELNLRPVERVETVAKATIQNEFVRPNKPVILRNFSREWLALEKWTYDYFKQYCGQVEVPLFAEAMAEQENSYLSSQNKMPFGAYLDLLQAGPTQWRMFLFNIFKHMPQLCDDFDYPPIFDRYAKKHPFMFFGGQTSYVDIHYDLDLSHVILTQFTGTKKVVLYGPEWSDYLYRHPLTVSCNVDFRQPDFDRYPLIAKTQGYECTLEYGDTLLIPTGYWHYIYYETSGFSLSLRARPEALSRRLHSWLKMFNLTVVDRAFAKTMGAKKWYEKKEHIAQKKAKRVLETAS